MLPSLESARLLKQVVEKSKRHTGVPLSIEFIRTEVPESPPPLASMLRGGRGGEVRLKLYLCLSLRAVRSPYDIRPSPGSWWAKTLALADPEGLGARRIADALGWLDAHKFVALERRHGSPPAITLLSPDGSGGPYTPRPGPRWVRVPLGFWEHQWITALSGSATALLLVLLDLQGGKMEADPPWLTGSQHPRYGLSDDTWTRATKELKNFNLLTVRRAPQGKDFDWRRMRNTYWIHIDRLDMALDPTTRAVEENSVTSLR